MTGSMKPRGFLNGVGRWLKEWQVLAPEETGGKPLGGNRGARCDRGGREQKTSGKSGLSNAASAAGDLPAGRPPF
jgi:hypothetical protein